MKESFQNLMARLGTGIHWLVRSKSSCAWVLRMLLPPLFGLAVTGVAHKVPPLIAHIRAAFVTPVTPAPQIFCPQADQQPMAGHQSIHLPDHTIVEVNSDACLTVEFTAKTRVLKLRSGEAIFQVAPDPRRPFVVETGTISIQALGTQFDVFRKEHATRVTVNEGAVQISSRDTKPRPKVEPLTVLRQIDVSDDPTQLSVPMDITSGDFARITAWTRGKIELEDQTLKEAFQEFSRYQHLQIEFSDPLLAQVPFSGTFHTNDVEQFLELLKLQCIHSDYNRQTARIVLSPVPGKRAGGACY